MQRFFLWLGWTWWYWIKGSSFDICYKQIDIVCLHYFLTALLDFWAVDQGYKGMLCFTVLLYFDNWSAYSEDVIPMIEILKSFVACHIFWHHGYH